ncbi:MAG: amino acid ABC transporter ATP-binding protein [Thermomicrobiales bacterium]|nr:amino acid ABC transporter ATP-binding protein [Thermomicrobiales bacterium]
MSALLRYESVYKAYGPNLVLQNINLDIPEHSVTCLIGASGCGKSTLLRCTNLLEEIQHGSIYLRETDLAASHKDADALRAKIGMVFQSYNLFPHMNVIKNITLAPVRVRGERRSDAEDRARDLLQRFGLLDKALEFPDRLSGGQQQRIAIIRALAMQPEVLLLDEVTSALDPEMVGEVMDIIIELKSLNMTMIMATHQMGFASQIADNVVFLDRGAVLEQGHPSSFFGNPQHERTRQFLERVTMAI